MHTCLEASTWFTCYEAGNSYQSLPHLSAYSSELPFLGMVQARIHDKCLPAHHSALIHREQERREERQRIRSEAGGVLDPMDEEGSFDDGDPYTTNLYIGGRHLQSCWECTQILLAPESAAYLCLLHHTQHFYCAAVQHYSFYIRTVHRCSLLPLCTCDACHL